MHMLFYGLAVGLVLGLTGAGGGILAVPALVLGMGWSPQSATPVALLAVGIAAAVGAIDGLRHGLVRWRAALLMATLGIIFAPLGVQASHRLSPAVLMTLFAAAMFLASARLVSQVVGRGASTGDPAAAAMGRTEKNCTLDAATGRLHWTPRCAATLSCIGSVAGLLTGMLGVGGGFLIVPACRQWTDLRVHGIVATSLLVIALVTLAATASSLHDGARIGQAGALFIVASVAGMFLGRGLSPRLPGPVVQVLFAGLSIAVALALLVRTWAT